MTNLACPIIRVRNGLIRAEFHWYLLIGPYPNRK